MKNLSFLTILMTLSLTACSGVPIPVSTSEPERSSGEMPADLGRQIPREGANSINSISTADIPAPSVPGAMALKVVNGTGGAYSDDVIYWSVLGINPKTGQWSYLSKEGILHPLKKSLNNTNNPVLKNGEAFANIYNRISDAGWVTLPPITSGRLYLCVGTPCYIKTFDNGFAGPNIDNPTDPNIDVYFDFVEFTLDSTGYHGNTTRVDGFGFPIQHRLINRTESYDQTVGEPENKSREELINAFKSEVPDEFKSLAIIQSPYRIVAPIHGDFKAGGPQGNYFRSYVDSIWKEGTKPTTQNILLCNGPLAEEPAQCAGLNRGVYENRRSWTTPAQYYSKKPANFYAKFWHDYSQQSLAYGFAYDDYNQQASYLEVRDPKALVIRVGW